VVAVVAAVVAADDFLLFARRRFDVFSAALRALGRL
jgi:hypothetical protein